MTERTETYRFDQARSYIVLEQRINGVEQRPRYAILKPWERDKVEFILSLMTKGAEAAGVQDVLPLATQQYLADAFDAHGAWTYKLP